MEFLQRSERFRPLTIPCFHKLPSFSVMRATRFAVSRATSFPCFRAAAELAGVMMRVAAEDLRHLRTLERSMAAMFLLATRAEVVSFRRSSTSMRIPECHRLRSRCYLRIRFLRSANGLTKELLIARNVNLKSHRT